MYPIFQKAIRALFAASATKEAPTFLALWQQHNKHINSWPHNEPLLGHFESESLLKIPTSELIWVAFFQAEMLLLEARGAVSAGRFAFSPDVLLDSLEELFPLLLELEARRSALLEYIMDLEPQSEMGATA